MTSASITQPDPPWPAPAKLNLILHVTGRRPDGYHLLQTVFQFLDFTDTLEFQVRTDGVITLTGNRPEIPAETDLIYRAARLLQQKTGTTAGMDIRLHKRIPIGGGLGGGSSDAATTLVALDQYWHTGMSIRELAALSLILGADVPVFVSGRAAFAEGVGELLTPFDPAEKWYVVAHPGISISTAAVFNDPDLTRNTPAITIRDFLGGVGLNDCEAVVRKRYPEVSQLIDWLGERVQARLTGTGACVYGACPDEASAGRILRDLPDCWQGFIAKGVNHSPLLERLALATGRAGTRSRDEAVTDA